MNCTTHCRMKGRMLCTMGDVRAWMARRAGWLLIAAILLAGCGEDNVDVRTVPMSQDQAVLPYVQQGVDAPTLAGDTAAFSPTQSLSGWPGTVYLEPGPPVQRPAGPPNPFEGNDRAESEGQRLFNWYNCGGCHGPNGGGGMGPNLRDDQWIYGSKPIDIYRVIAEGRPEGMPTF